MLGLSGIEAGEDFVSGMVRGGHVGGSWKGVVDAGSACAVGHEGLSEVICLVTPWVDQSVRENLQFVGVGIEGPDSAFAQTTNTPWSFNVGVYVYGLGKADATVLGMAESMDDMVSVFGA